MIRGVVPIDCITSPPFDAMRAAGVSGLSRYLSWADDRDTLHKVIHRDDDLDTYNLKAVEGRLTNAIKSIVVPVTMTDADRKAIADLVIAGIPKPPTAAEIADELTRRGTETET
jgi:hypothetical protein